MSGPTIGIVANVYQEANALPGWLEAHLPFADDVRVHHAGPQGTWSDDGTIEILEKWRVPITFGSIDKGFGVVRTFAIRQSPCDYVMLLDADERFYAAHCILICSGESTPQSEVDTILQSYDFRDLRTVLPNWENVGKLGANLTVTNGGTYNQGHVLRKMLDSKPDAVATIRRHWHDLSLRRPTQNWQTDHDWQMRVVRQSDDIYFDPNTRMHERLVGANNVVRAEIPRGPFFDHFHFTFKRMEEKQRAHDIKIYDAIHAGQNPPTAREFDG